MPSRAVVCLNPKWPTYGHTDGPTIDGHTDVHTWVASVYVYL